MGTGALEDCPVSVFSADTVLAGSPSSVLRKGACEVCLLLRLWTTNFLREADASISLWTLAKFSNGCPRPPNACKWECFSQLCTLSPTAQVPGADQETLLSPPRCFLTPQGTGTTRARFCVPKGGPPKPLPRWPACCECGIYTACRSTHRCSHLWLSALAHLLIARSSRCCVNTFLKTRS